MNGFLYKGTRFLSNTRLRFKSEWGYAPRTHSIECSNYQDVITSLRLRFLYVMS